MSPTIEQTVNTYFELGNAMNVEGLKSICADNFVHEFRPASLGGMGAPNRTLDQFSKFIEGELKGMVKALNFTLPPKQLIVGEKTAVAHVFAVTDTIRDTKHDNEFVVIFNFNDEGKITSVTEFMDSKAILDELAVQKEWSAKKA